MTLDNYLEHAKQTGEAPPTALRNASTVEALIAAGMDCIRRNLAESRKLALAAGRTAAILKDPGPIGAASRLRGHVELLAGRSRQAVRHYERARSAFAQNELERAATAVAMLQALAYTGDYDRGFAIGEEAIDVFLRNGDKVRAARVRVNLGNAYHRLDQLTRARTEYEQALPVLADTELVGDLAIAMRNFGVILMAQQEFAEADAMYSRAREAFVAAEHGSLVLEVDLNRAYLMGRQGLVREALIAYRGLRQNLPVDLGYEIGHGFLDEADLMLDCGLWSDATDAASRAKEVFLGLGSRFEIGKASLLEATAWLRRGQLMPARKNLREARRLLAREPNQVWQARTLLAQSELLLLDNLPARAAKLLVRAEELAGEDGVGMEARRRRLNLAINDQDRQTIEALLPEASNVMLAKVARLRGETAVSRRHALAALEHMDLTRRDRGGNRLRQAATTAQEQDLRECFRCLTRPEDRLAVVLRIKQRALAEAVAMASASRPIGQTTLRADSADDRAGRLQKLREDLRTAEPMRVDELALPAPTPGVQLVELFEDAGRLWAFVVEPSGLMERDLGDIEPWLRMGRRLRFEMGRVRTARTDSVDQVLRWFGERFAEVLDSSLPKIIIGREIRLAGLPVHAFQTAEGPLIERADCGYVPSLGVWKAIQQRSPVPGARPVVFGYADEHAPAIENELLRVARKLGVEPTASEHLVEALAGAELIHLAAHGIVREDQPLFSALRFGDLELSPADLIGVPMRAQLAVLSGCSTGVSSPGESHDADGFIEALLAAGCRCVLAALWDVSDQATEAWMDTFYDCLQDLPVGLAYREATLRHREKYPHPAEWAPFSLFGDPDHKTCITAAAGCPRKGETP